VSLGSFLVGLGVGLVLTVVLLVVGYFLLIFHIMKDCP
jgi:hypothetical protein